jgi:membrane protein implicated in regulation of membrane protease activity
VIVALGLLLRAEVIALGGAFLLAMSLCADWFGLTQGPGIGWKQQVLVAAGLVCLAVALVRRHGRAFFRSRHAHEECSTAAVPQAR